MTFLWHFIYILLYLLNKNQFFLKKVQFTGYIRFYSTFYRLHKVLLLYIEMHNTNFIHTPV
jgi:hypothetical protein